MATRAVPVWAAAAALACLAPTSKAADADGAEAVARVSFAFAPPIDVPLQLDLRRAQRANDGQLYHFTARYALRFSAAGRGYRLTSRLVELESDAPSRLAGSFTGMLAPLKGVDVEFLVSPDGTDVDLVDGEALWTRIGLVDAVDGAVGTGAEARAMAQMLRALSPAQRESILSVDVIKLLAFAGRVAEAGPVRDAGGVAPIGADQNPSGVRRIERRARDVIIVENALTAPAGSGPRFDTRSAWRVAPDSGLVLLEERTTALHEPATASAALQAQVTRTLSIDPRPPTQR